MQSMHFSVFEFMKLYQIMADADTCVEPSRQKPNSIPEWQESSVRIPQGEGHISQSQLFIPVDS